MSFQGLPYLFARLKGKNGRVREYRSVLNPASDYSFLPKVDAFALGYTEAAYTEFVTRPANLVSIATGNGISEGPLIQIVEASVGPIVVRGVDFIAFDLSQQTTCDVVLGKSFLQSLKMSIDYPNRKVTLQNEREQ